MNNINDLLNKPGNQELKEMHENVSEMIEWSKQKINNLFWDNIEYIDRLNMLLNQPYIKQLTLEELKANYIDYLEQLIRLNLFNSVDLMMAFDFILDLLIKKESEK